MAAYEMSPPAGIVRDLSRLSPEDAAFGHSHRRARQQPTLPAIRDVMESRKPGRKDRSRSRKKAQWKKLLWVEQQYPDNYTDGETFLHDLKRNPSFQQYEFWPLMADATVIIQHLCSVAIFVCCFAGIIQERVSPVTIVGCGTLGTLIGWVLWDFWVGREEVQQDDRGDSHSRSDTTDQGSGTVPTDTKDAQGLAILLPEISMERADKGHSHNMSTVSATSNISTASLAPGPPTGSANFANHGHWNKNGEPAAVLSPRHQHQLATFKSASLIYCALLGLSPILKSLTKSTTSDSIWAMSCWLLLINVFFFDYGGGVTAKFPASLSTNAALMASTVLASRLPSTTHVFSLTLFSIEVFGLFPVFRRHLKRISRVGHTLLTVFLVIVASAAMGMTVTGGGLSAGFGGAILGCITTFLAMGICSWWLIGLQKYKNEIHGPWDPARPIIRRRWD